MNQPQPVPTRSTWLVIFGALSVSVFIYGLLCFLIENGSQPRTTNPASVAQMRPILIALAATMLAGSVLWMRLRVDGKIGGEGRDVVLSPGEFQTHSIIGLALSEACSIYGLLLFFIGAPLQEFAFFGLGTLFVNFAFILPRGLEFWKAHEKSLIPLNPNP